MTFLLHPFRRGLEPSIGQVLCLVDAISCGGSSISSQVGLIEARRSGHVPSSVRPLVTTINCLPPVFAIYGQPHISCARAIIFIGCRKSTEWWSSLVQDSWLGWLMHVHLFVDSDAQDLLSSDRQRALVRSLQALQRPRDASHMTAVKDRRRQVASSLGVPDAAQLVAPLYGSF